jgi:hypothetical protein
MKKLRRVPGVIVEQEAAEAAAAESVSA